jgi:alkylhydroperoxidase/carboxymuconolactone decarboxylase family protein YurZ
MLRRSAAPSAGSTQHEMPHVLLTLAVQGSHQTGGPAAYTAMPVCKRVFLLL